MRLVRWILLLAWFATPLMAAPPIAVRPPAVKEVPCYEKCELDVDVPEDSPRSGEQRPTDSPRCLVGGKWCNPFDPEEIRVDVPVTSPSGRKYTVPAFYCGPYLVRNTAAGDRRREVTFCKLFLDARDWADTSPEIVIAEIRLLTGAPGGARVVDDFADLGRAQPTDPEIERIPDPERNGAWLLRFRPKCSPENPWPGLVWKFKAADWSRAIGLNVRYKVKGGKAGAALQMLFSDARFGRSAIEKFTPARGSAGSWQEARWDWRAWRPQITSFRSGPAGWKVRLAPTEVGEYRVTARLHTAAGDAEAAPIRFTAVASANPGFVRVSRDDPHYFVFDNGSPFVPIGHDIAWKLQDVVDLFPKFAAHGENATYFIFRPSELLIEWSALGVYDLERAAKFDAVVEAARRYGIYFKLSLDLHEAFNVGKRWKDNPYNRQRGGPCATPKEFYTSDAAWIQYRKRLRYTVARWGYSPNIMAWEPVAEMNGGVQLRKLPSGELEDDFLSPFYRKMAAELKRLDPHARLFTTSYDGDTSYDRHWALPEIEYTQIHCYSLDDPGRTLPAWTRELTGRFAKPLMFTEFGWGTEGPEPGMDPLGINLHDGIWGSMAAGAAGALDWWSTVIEANNLYFHFPPLRAFVTGVDFPRESFRPCRVTVAPAKQCARRQSVLSANLEWYRPPQNDLTIDAEGRLAAEAGLSGSLTARGKRNQSSSRRFHVDFPTTSTFSLYVEAVYRDALLEMRLDDHVIRTVPLPAENAHGRRNFYNERSKLWKCIYNEIYCVTVPPGRHTVSLENIVTNTGWIKAPAIIIEDFGPPRPATVDVLGLTGNRTTLLWLWNPAGHWLNWWRAAPKPIAGINVKVEGLPIGRHRVEWWNTWTGAIESRTEMSTKDGSLLLAAPPVQRDLACRIRRMPIDP